MNKRYDVIVIGGGAAGMSAALGAYENGAHNVLLIERDQDLGGVLLQCVHNGFGLHHFNEELTGPAYAERVKNQVLKTAVEIKLNSVVMKITTSKEVHFMNSIDGYVIVEASSIVVAVGCRERTRYQIDLPGKRLAGIMTAGQAQHYLNIEGYLVGKKVFILGSGDIGLIMARRMTLEGAQVLGVAEIMPYSNGLNRNIAQCLNDFDIPLFLSHTVTQVMGKNRLEGIELSKVDEKLNPIPGTQHYWEVDTLLLSIGLIPENQLLKHLGVTLHRTTQGALVDQHYETNVPGIFTCGNGLHVHDLVDYVSQEGYAAGKQAALNTLNSASKTHQIVIQNGGLVRYVVPASITLNEEGFDNELHLKFRISQPLPQGTITVRQGNTIIKESKKMHMMPSEMEKIILTQDVVKSLTYEPLVVEVKGGTI